VPKTNGGHQPGVLNEKNPAKKSSGGNKKVLRPDPTGPRDCNKRNEKPRGIAAVEKTDARRKKKKAAQKPKTASITRFGTYEGGRLNTNLKEEREIDNPVGGERRRAKREAGRRESR